MTEIDAAPPRDKEGRPVELLLGIPVWILFGIIGAFMATMKGRSGCAWFILCVLLGPFGLIFAAVVSKKK